MEERQIPLLDLSRQFESIKDEIFFRIEEVFKAQQFIMGPQCKELEGKLASLCGADTAVACGSGTDALSLSLMALGVGKGDEVIVPAFTFFATAEAVSAIGATPVFVDIEPEGMMIDPEAAEAAITPRTVAIIPVHLFGQCACMEKILAISEKHSLAVIEDMAQAIGASRFGRLAGSFGVAGALSFYPTKNLGGAGDGGMVVSKDKALAARIRKLGNHGQVQTYISDEIGRNSRLATLQAAVLLAKLSHLEKWTQARQSHARAYDAFFSNEGKAFVPPRVLEGNVHTYHQYVIRTEKKERLQEYFALHGVKTGNYYPLPLPFQPVYRNLGWEKEDFPVAHQICQTGVALPIFPELTSEEREYILSLLRSFRG